MLWTKNCPLSSVLLKALLFYKIARARLRTRRRRRRAKKEEKKWEDVVHKNHLSIVVVFVVHYYCENDDEIVVVFLLLLLLIRTSECGVAKVGGKDFIGDVVARVSRARVLKRPPETRLRRRDAPRAD